jgi:alpha,alpha-trehalase
MNQRVFATTGFMHEKYDVTAADGGIGGGGEYQPQVGFGWSNGVVLDFLAHYV